jgi:hypothetical protein
MKVRIETPRHTVGKTDPTQRMNEVLSLVASCCAMSFQIRERSSKCFVVCRNEFCSEFIWCEQCSHTDWLWCHEQQFKGLYFSTSRSQRPNGREWLATKEPSKSFFIKFWS